MMTRVKKIFSSKIFYIVFSLLASLTIWMYVEYIENPDVTRTINGIKVEFLHEDYVTDRGLVITSRSPDTVSVRFAGKRNIISRIDNTNLTATVDLAQVDTTGQYQRPYTIVFPLDISTSPPTQTKITDYVLVTVDKLAKKDIPVKSIFTGGVAEGYQAEPIEADPALLTVTGPQNVLSSISYAWVSVDRENVSKTIDDSLPFILMDKEGHEVVSDNLTFSSDTVHVIMPVVMIKTVTLQVNLTPGAGADETNAVSTITPSTITLTGSAELLKDINQLTLGTIDLSKFLNNTTKTFDIAIPDGMTNVTGIAQAQVSVQISGLESKHFNVTNIQPINVPAGYTAEIITTNVDVTLRGKPGALMKLTPDNIRIVADLSDLGAATGGYNITAKISVDGDTTGAGAVGEYKVTVFITKNP